MKREERDASLGGEEARMAAAENSHKI